MYHIEEDSTQLTGVAQHYSSHHDISRVLNELREGEYV